MRRVLGPVKVPVCVSVCVCVCVCVCVRERVCVCKCRETVVCEKYNYMMYLMCECVH